MSFNFDKLKWDRPGLKEGATPLKSLIIESSDNREAKAEIYLLPDGTFQSVLHVNSLEIIGVSNESPELAVENALNELGNISKQEQPIWTLKYDS